MSPVARSLAVPLVLLTGLGMGVVAPQRPASIAPPPELLARWQRTDRLREVMRRANQLRPQRRDFPARYENIGDVEVREIERMAVKFVPRALVNIGTVVTGCACEEGPDCTDQVWIVASNPEKSHGLQMSRINKRWVVGEVQQWWLRLERLQASRERFKTYNEYQRAEESVIEDFPSCAPVLLTSADAASATEPRPPDSSPRP